MIESLPAPTAVQALLLLVVVLIEAVVLYLGYGYVERLLAPFVIKTIKNK
ncbi:hypothetical protein [Natronomonas sp.]